MFWLANMPTICLCIDKLRFTAAKGSIWIALPSLDGLAKQPTSYGLCSMRCWLISKDHRSCSWMRPAHQSLIPIAKRPKLDTFGPWPVMTGHGIARIHPVSPSPMHRDDPGNTQIRYWRASRAFCRLTAMPDTTACSNSKTDTSNLPIAGGMRAENCMRSRRQASHPLRTKGCNRSLPSTGSKRPSGAQPRMIGWRRGNTMRNQSWIPSKTG